MTWLDQIVPSHPVKARRIVGKCSVKKPSYYHANRDAILAARRDVRLANPQLRAATQKRYDDKTKEKKAAANAARYKAKQEKIERLQLEIRKLRRQLTQIETAQGEE